MTPPLPSLLPMHLARTVDAALVAGAALRVTRLITTDTLPEFLVIRHARGWAERADTRADGWRHELVEGADCPFCFGFWAGAAVLGTYAGTQNTPRARAIWRFTAAALTLNYITGHVSSRIDT